MLKKIKFLVFMGSLLVQTFFFASKGTSHAELAVIPQDLAEIKAKQVSKLVGLKVKEKDAALKKKEQRLLLKLQYWFADVLNSEKSNYKLCLASFFMGILTSLTPCLYPMIPVTAGILASGAEVGFFHQLLKSATYTLGVATVHSGLGYVAATQGIVFGKWLSNPYVALAMILFFLFLAFSMFGYYDINFRLNSQNVPKNRSIIMTYFYGLFMGCAASPCLTPILMILLGFVGTMAEPMYGFLILFSFSLGLNIILMLVGLFTGLFVALPKPGSWMLEIKKILGFLMLFGCLYFASPFLKTEQILAFMAGIFFLAFVYYTYSTMNDRVVDLIHYNQDAIESVQVGLFGNLSFSVIVKTILSVACFVLAGYFAYAAYLTWHKLTTLKLIAKYFLK